MLREVGQGLSNPRRIRDHYLEGGRLRLRLVEDLTGGVLERKLGHKRRLVESDPAAVYHTSLYLNEAEFALLSGLPGRSLMKVRWATPTDGHMAAVDVFEDDLEGLIMLEVEFRSRDEWDAYRPPAWVGPEVTDREEYCGGALSAATGEDMTGLLGLFDQQSDPS